MGEPSILAGPSALRGALAPFAGPAVALVDRVVSETAAGVAAREHLRSHHRFAEVVLVDSPPTAQGLVDFVAGHPGVRLVVGIGGGTVMDQVKLLAALYRRADTARFLTVSQRAGFTSLGEAPERDVALVIMPTTLGTGAEMSRVACLEGSDGKRLIEGELLRADTAVFDPQATATLPGRLVMEGIFEAWSRLLGGLAGGPSAVPSEDALAIGIATRLTQLGDEVRTTLAEGRAPGGDLRLEVARLSAMSHSHWLHLLRPPFGYKAWCLATELASYAGGRKVPALAAVLPPVWAEILSGSGVLGDRRALLRAWQAVSEAASPALPDDPVEGLYELLRSWKVSEGAIGNVDPEVVGRSAMRRWGAGLPMLGAADGPLLERIFDACRGVSTATFAGGNRTFLDL